MNRTRVEGAISSRTGQSYKKIDFRCRPPSDQFLVAESSKYDTKVSSRLEDKGAMPPLAKTISMQQFMKELDANNIEKAVAVGRDLETTYGVKVSIEHIAHLVKSYPDRLIGFTGIDPNKGLGAIRTIERAVELGLKGVSIDAHLAKMPVDDRRLYLVYGKCADLGIPVVVTLSVVHMAPQDYPMDGNHPRRVERIACDLPDLKIIITHAGYPWIMDVIWTLARHPNVYVELHGHMLNFAGMQPLLEAANTYLQDQVLYSSAYPWGPLNDYLKTNGYIKEDIWSKYFYDNAARLLSIS